MLVHISLDNIEKRFEWICELIEYTYEDEMYIITKWKDSSGIHKTKLILSKYNVQESKKWIQDIFESLIVGEIWKWE